MKGCSCLLFCQPQITRPLSEGQTLGVPCCKLEESKDAPASTSALQTQRYSEMVLFQRPGRTQKCLSWVEIQSQLSAHWLNIARAEMHRLVGPVLHNRMKPSGTLCWISVLSGVFPFGSRLRYRPPQPSFQVVEPWGSKEPFTGWARCLLLALDALDALFACASLCRTAGNHLQLLASNCKAASCACILGMAQAEKPAVQLA